MVGKLLIDLVMMVNAGSMYLISIMKLGVSVHIRFPVNEHSLKVRRRGELSRMVHLQSIPQMTGCIEPIFNFW